MLFLKKHFYYIYLYNDIVVRFRNLQWYFSKSLFLSLLPAIIWLFVNATVNQHSHRISEGYTVTHAHPYNTSTSDSGPIKSHHHSETELLLLSLISSPVSLATALFVLIFFKIAISWIFNSLLNQSAPVLNHYQIHHYHGPPVL